MTRWEKFIEQHDYQFFHFGIAAEEINKKDFNWLKKECAKAKKKGVSANNTLIGHIKEEYKMPGISKSLHNYLCSVASTHKNFDLFNKKLNILSENRPLYLHSFWVNYQKKHEFNPIHDHDGIYSFVIFVNIPYDLTEEENYFSEVSIKESKSEIQTSKFNFVNIGPDGKIVSTIAQVDKSFEGKMFMFPSKQMHLVYPFYTSDDYRITVSGNIKIKV